MKELSKTREAGLDRTVEKGEPRDRLDQPVNRASAATVLRLLPPAATCPTRLSEKYFRSGLYAVFNTSSQLEPNAITRVPV